MSPDSGAGARPASGQHGQPGQHGEPLEAILLVGGKGTRLRPLTLSVPKPLLPTAGVPFLAHQLARAASFGVTRVVLATSYRSQMFAECFGDGSGFGLELDYVDEEEPLGTGGGIRNAASRLHSGPDDPVVVLNGDILSGHDLSAQLDLHRKSEAAVTLHLVPVSDPSRFGCVPTDDRGRVTAFLEKTPNPVTNHINAGCYVYTRRAIDEIPAGRVVSVERETFPQLIESGQVVMGYPDDAYWLDVGTPEAYVRGSCDLVLGRLASPAVPAVSGEALVLPGAVVDEDAVITGGSTIGPGAVVGPGATVDGSVVFEGATIAAGARITGSVLGHRVKVDSDTVLDGALLGDDVSIAAGNELRGGLRVWPGVELGPVAIRFSTDA
jgi:mannose-1-phosphate guanylyltransferase